MAFLNGVAEIFGFDEAEFQRIRATYLGDDPEDPYEILGVAADVDDRTLRDHYRALIRENHPDRMIADGLPEEFVELANQKMAAINAAYCQILKERGLGGGPCD